MKTAPAIRMSVLLVCILSLFLIAHRLNGQCQIPDGTECPDGDFTGAYAGNNETGCDDRDAVSCTSKGEIVPYTNFGTTPDSTNTYYVVQIFQACYQRNTCKYNAVDHTCSLDTTSDSEVTEYGYEPHTLCLVA